MMIHREKMIFGVVRVPIQRVNVHKLWRAMPGGSCAQWKFRHGTCDFRCVGLMQASLNGTVGF